MKYIVTGSKFSGSFTLKYGSTGLLVAVLNDSDIDDPVRLTKILSVFPITESGIQGLRATGAIVREVPDDISFEAFWNAYGYKVGKRSMAENTWNRMKEVDRIRAIAYIAIYDTQLAKNGAAKAYPSTYLNQRYYDN